MKRVVIATGLAALIVSVAPSGIADAAKKATPAKAKAKPAAKATVAPTTAAPVTTAAPAATAAPATVAAAPAKAKCPDGDKVNILVAYEANQPAGMNFRRGVQMAAADINKAGGILGCKISLDEQDTQNVPDKSKQIIAKGVESKPFVIMGTVFSGSTIVNMIEAQRAKIPQFTGGEAASLTDRKINGNNDYIFRTSFGQSISFPKVANYIADDQKFKKVVVVYINNDFGIGGRDAIRRVLKEKNVEIVKEVVGQPGQTDFSAEVATTNSAGGEGVFVYMNETENANFLKEVKKQAVTLPMIGETTLTSPAVLGLTGAAANGASAHVGLSSAAPMFNDWVTKYLAFTKVTSPADYPDHNSIKGYTGLHIVKEMAERQNGFNSEKLAKELHCTKITTKDEPGIFLDVETDANGDIDRQSFLTKVVNGEERIVKTLPAIGGKRPGC
jgi:branched-chain amino acid transport system substrate-binding protein